MYIYCLTFFFNVSRHWRTLVQFEISPMGNHTFVRSFIKFSVPRDHAYWYTFQKQNRRNISTYSKCTFFIYQTCAITLPHVKDEWSVTNMNHEHFWDQAISHYSLPPNSKKEKQISFLTNKLNVNGFYIFQLNILACHCCRRLIQ